MKGGRKLQRSVGKRLASLLPDATAFAFVTALARRRPGLVIDAVKRHLMRDAPPLSELPVDLPTDGATLRFEHLSGLFAATTFDESVILMNVRQAAYVFGLIRDTKPDKVIEIGRFKGGSTFLIAAAMAGHGRFWSIDLGAANPQLAARGRPPIEKQIGELCRRFGLNVELVNGDSRTVEIDTGEVDLVFIDGDHSSAMARNDFDRFGRRVRIGGAVLFDDAFDDGFHHVPWTDGVGPVVREVQAQGDFRLVKAVKRLAHLERVR